MTIKETIVSGLIVTIIGGIALALFQFYFDSYITSHQKISSNYSQEKFKKLTLVDAPLSEGRYINFIPLSAVYNKSEENYYVFLYKTSDDFSSEKLHVVVKEKNGTKEIISDSNFRLYNLKSDIQTLNCKLTVVIDLDNIKDTGSKLVKQKLIDFSVNLPNFLRFR